MGTCYQKSERIGKSGNMLPKMVKNENNIVKCCKNGKL